MALPSLFTEDSVRSLGGPDWLSRRRLDAFGRAVSRPLPTGDEEIWRYSRIGDLAIERFSPRPGDGGEDVVDPRVREFLETVGERAALVVVRDGELAAVEPGDDAEGLEVQGLYDLAEAEAGLGEVAESFIARGHSALSADDSAPTDAFDDLATAYLRSCPVISVQPGSVLRHPVVVVNTFSGSSGSGSGTGPGGGDQERGPAHAGRTIVRAGENSESSVIEILLSGNDPMLVLPTVEIDVADSARLSYSVVQQLGRATWEIGHMFASAGRDSTFRMFQASLGGEYARSRVDSVLAGQGGTAQLLAAYLGDGDQMHDFRTLQEHDAPRSTSDLVFKGAVGDRSRSVYSGLIRMRKGAKAASAFQTNRNLVLSDGAHADSVPNLDIEENDVRCSHASAVGPVDEEQRFYLESRGVPHRAAERLIVLGFFRELLERVPDPVARHVVSAIEDRVSEMTGAEP